MSCTAVRQTQRTRNSQRDTRPTHLTHTSHRHGANAKSQGKRHSQKVDHTPWLPCPPVTNRTQSIQKGLLCPLVTVSVSYQSHTEQSEGFTSIFPSAIACAQSSPILCSVMTWGQRGATAAAAASSLATKNTPCPMTAAYNQHGTVSKLCPCPTYITGGNG